MTVFGGGDPEGEQAAAWRAAGAAFDRFDAADRLLFSVPMWNASVPYILKQFIDVVSQPAWIFRVDPGTGYQPLLAGSGKQATVIYTSAVWGPELGPEFGCDFQSTFFRDRLERTGITAITEIRYHPTLTGDRDAAFADGVAAAFPPQPQRGAVERTPMNAVIECPLDPTRLEDHVDQLYRAARALYGSCEDAEDLVMTGPAS